MLQMQRKNVEIVEKKCQWNIEQGLNWKELYHRFALDLSNIGNLDGLTAYSTLVILSSWWSRLLDFKHCNSIKPFASYTIISTALWSKLHNLGLTSNGLIGFFIKRSFFHKQKWLATISKLCNTVTLNKIGRCVFIECNIIIQLY